MEQINELPSIGTRDLGWNPIMRYLLKTRQGCRVCGIFNLKLIHLTKKENFLKQNRVVLYEEQNGTEL